MSNLSELLNPIPTLQTSASIHTSSQEQQTDTAQYPSTSSLPEALTVAPTGIAPDMSQAQPLSASLVSSESRNPGYPNPSSRPGSSHLPLPIPVKFSQISSHHEHYIPPTFEDHNTPQHPEDRTRLSDIANGTSRQLPPLRGLMSDEMKPPTAGGLTEGFQNGTVPTTNQLDQSVQLSQYKDIDGEEQPSDVAQDALLTRSTLIETPGAKYHTESDTYVSNEPIAVKTESRDQTQVVPRDSTGTEQTVITHEELFDAIESAIRIDPITQIPSEGTAEVDVIKPEVVTSSNLQTETPVTDSKKRPAPKSDKKVEKKGTASAIKKPAAKRRKVEPESMAGTPFSQRSGTPVSSRASKTPAPKNRKQDSVTPMNSSPAPIGDSAAANGDEDMEEGSELFCICRKPDDHTWMIACDGGCEDWFHGRCVDMNERDGKLIDKYICPNCRDKGLGQTIWKPMCRLESCREPARITGPVISKYCSDKHGEEFMRKRAIGDDSRQTDGKGRLANTRKRRKINYTNHDGNGNGGNSSPTKSSPLNEDEDDQPILRGGVLRPPELKALTTNVQSLLEFRKLGEGVLSPPQTAITSPNNNTEGGKRLLSKSNDQYARSSEKPGVKVVYTPDEESQLAGITEKRTALKRARAAVSDREKFLGLVKGRAKNVLEELKKRESGIKDICGFDARLIWSDEEFDAWRASSEGQKVLEMGILGPPSPSSPVVRKSQTATEDTSNNPADTASSQLPDDVNHTTLVSPTAGEKADVEENDRAIAGVCQKKRCERHKQWFKLQQTEWAFEKEECRRLMRGLEREEKGVVERAMVRCLEGGEEGEEDGKQGEQVKTGAEEAEEVDEDEEEEREAG